MYSSAIVMSKGGLSAGAATICDTIWSQPPTVSTLVPYLALKGSTTAWRKLSSWFPDHDTTIRLSPSKAACAVDTMALPRRAGMATPTAACARKRRRVGLKDFMFI